MYREMILKMEDEETAIAFFNDRQLMELYLPEPNRQHLLGNIYQGVVENVLPGMQAAFVNIGLEKNSFLYVDDVVAPKFLGEEAAAERGETKANIGDLLKRHQEVLVQVFKEPSGSKGARVTMQPTLPGRYLVLLPAGNYIAVSRRIEDETERERLKGLLQELLPEQMGGIIRTVAAGVGREALAEDLKLLLKQWRRIQGRAAKSSAPLLISQDLDLLKRVVRDTNAADLERIVVNSRETAEKLREVIASIAPALAVEILVKEDEDLFAAYDVYGQMEKALRRKVWLKSGGYIVFDQMEALTAIDVNTGKYVGESSLNDTVCKINLEAVTEIARQLRLRNIGGIVIIDFIDMENPEDKTRLLEALIEATKTDRTRVTVMGMTQLGLVELTRKKNGHELAQTVEKECPFCGGKGRVLHEDFLLPILEREIRQAAAETAAPALLIAANQSAAARLLGPQGRRLAELERELGKRLILSGEEQLRMEDYLVRPLQEDEAAFDRPPLLPGQRYRLRIQPGLPEAPDYGRAELAGYQISIRNGGDLLGQEAEVVIDWVEGLRARAHLSESWANI